METNNIKLTIVIPYFETYELTDRLLRSLLTQINDDVEIILIDDGCNENRFDVFDGCFQRVKIIHQKNKGVAKSRNEGIELAKGKYIAFIDSDDMIMINYIETLINLIDNRDEDIIYFNWLDINTNDVIRHPQNPAVWKAIYKKEIIPLFNEKLKTREDYYFLNELSKRKNTEYYYDKVLYIYNSNRENSLSWKDKKGEL